MAIICRTVGLLFIMVPRTGCSAIGRALISELDGAWLPESDILSPDGSLIVGKKHCTPSQIIEHGILSDAEMDSLFKVTCVRNPFDSLVSLYTKRRDFPTDRLNNPSFWMHRAPEALREVERCRSHTFAQWIRRKYMVRSLLAALGVRRRGMFDQFTQGVDFVMRFDNLQEDFDEALRRVGAPKKITIPRVNQTLGRDPKYRSYYSTGSRKIVERGFRRDLDRYGFKF
jgi:hypothetical protein